MEIWYRGLYPYTPLPLCSGTSYRHKGGAKKKAPHRFPWETGSFCCL